MPARRVRVAPTPELRAGLDALRAEAGVPTAFPAEVEAEAVAAAARAPEGERSDLPFVTVDPPGSRDLDQALHIEARGDGHRVSYAIADVAAWVGPGGAIDAEAHARGVTVYAPDHRTPLHPPALSEGAASLLPGQWTPAVLWTLDLDATGELVGTDVRRALVQSRAQLTYEDLPPEVADAAPGRGGAAPGAHAGAGRRGARGARAGGRRGGRGLDDALPRPACPARTGTRRSPCSRAWPRRSSCSTTASGILRTQPAPDPKALARLRLQATALGTPWPEGEPYAAFIARLDPGTPAHAALLREATGVGRGAGYTAFDGAPPAERTHFALAAEYAHATAPLRRLQDRYVSECCLAAAAGTEVPAWVRAALPGLPATMAGATRKANAVERGVLDLAEALLLQGREGERFAGLVVDDDLVQLAEPAVRAKLPGAPPPGTSVTVVLRSADPAARKVTFAVA